MQRLRLALLLVLLPLPAAAEPPAALVEATEEAMSFCTSVGGAPAILDGYRTEADLNGDGVPDILTDLARIECGGAWSAFCGPSGCPVSAWLSAPGGQVERFDFGRLTGIAVEPGAPLPVVVAQYAPVFCGGEATQDCVRRWTFTSNTPAMPPIDTSTPVAPAAHAAQGTAQGAAPVAAGSPLPSGGAAPMSWTLRLVPGGSPAALGPGTGPIREIAAFCLSDKPFLAMSFSEPPKSATARLRFGFSSGPVEISAGREDSIGGAYVAALERTALAARLGGKDSKVSVSIDGKDVGALSLAGSTKALRGALADCGGL